MSVQVKRRREAASFLATFVGAQGELVVDTTNSRVQVHDGVTAGGHPAARLDEVVIASGLTTLALGAAGSTMQFGILEQAVTLSGASTSSAIQIPARAIVFAVSSRTIVAVTGAPSYSVGVTGTPTQFGSSLGASAGSTNSGVIGPTAFYAATSILISATSGSFTAGQVRIAIQYMLCGTPTS